MNANEIKFGIEVETHLSKADPTHVGSYRFPNQVEWLPSGWKVGKDCSIKAMHRGQLIKCDYHPTRKDAEFVSPILVGEAGLKEAHAAVKKIDERGATVNASCGVHVTITFPANNGAALARLICLFAHFETGLAATTGSKARLGSTYAQSVKQWGASTLDKKKKVEQTEQACKRDRYMALNLTHIANGNDRLEFRLFSGSTNADKIIAWVRLVLAIAEFCLTTETAVAFDAKGKTNFVDNHGFGDGRRSIYKLLCKLGWLKTRGWGYNGKEYGTTEFDGLPTVKDMCKTLQRLAKKYDAE
jgi:hypothetical protein